MNNKVRATSILARFESSRGWFIIVSYIIPRDYRVDSELASLTFDELRGSHHLFLPFAVIIILPAILNLGGARRWFWNVVRLPIVVTVV